ncbi:MAG: alpha/beta hydrolase [Clostridia bacterium]|nr:alpha/beta hydrolase [Clostridia bacterium]
MRRITDLSYGEFSANRLDLYLPEQDSFDLLVYYHGGGLSGGGKEKQAHLFELLVQRGIGVASVEYRMYPDAAYPDFIEDAACSAAWIKHHIVEFGNCRRIFLGGSSAGGYLSMMLCFDPRWLGAHGLSVDDFAGFVHDAGQPTKHFNVLRAAGEDPRRLIVDETAPLYHVGTTQSYPPKLIIVSDHDLKNRYEQTLLLVSTLKHFDVPEESVVLRVFHGKHCQYLRKKEPEGNLRFVDAVAEFIKDVQ